MVGKKMGRSKLIARKAENSLYIRSVKWDDSILFLYCLVHHSFINIANKHRRRNS